MVSHRVVVGQGSLEGGSRRSQVAGMEQDQAEQAPGRAGFRGALFGLGFPQEELGGFPRLERFAAREVS